MEPGNPFAYKYTQRLCCDLIDTFGQLKSDGLCLCEMGSMKFDENIDDVFARRSSAHHRTPAKHYKIRFVDSARNLKEYLQGALEACSLVHLTVHSAPPYAFIGRSQKLSVLSPKYFCPLPENPERRAVAYSCHYLEKMSISY